MIQVLNAKKIVEAEGITNLHYVFRKDEYYTGITDTEYMVVSNEGGKLVLDFGKEMCGGISLHIYHIISPNETRVSSARIRFGESLTEANAELGEKGSTNHHSPRDFEQVLSGGSNLVYGNTGFRFVRIDFRPGATVLLKAVKCVNNILRLPTEYKYTGGDKLVEKIFNASKRTGDLCAGQGLVLEGIKRDRAVWMGDLAMAMRGYLPLYKRVKEIEKSLDLVRRQSEKKGGWSCSLPTESMYWVINVADYYLKTKDKKFINRQLKFFKEQVAFFSTFIAEDGTMSFPRYFIDWASHGSGDEEVFTRMASVWTAKRAIEVLTDLGEDTSVAEKFLEKALKGDMTVKVRKQIIGVKYYVLGEISDEEYGRLIKNGVEGFAPSSNYFILNAIASRDKELAIKLMKDYYGLMIEKGATTIWEGFEPWWAENSGRIDRPTPKGKKDIHADFGEHCFVGTRNSLCHAWGMAIAGFIAENC